MKAIQAVIIALVLLSPAGCKKKASSPGSDSTQDATDPTYPKEPPSEAHWWTKSEVTAFIVDSMGLTDIQLTPAVNHGFTGTGKNPAGTVFTLKVTQQPGKILCEYQGPPGSGVSGSNDFKK
jgi:hypothetical protein